MQEVRVVDEQDHSGRLIARLGGVRRLQPPALEARRRMLEEGITDHLVQLVGRHLDPSLANHLERHRQQSADPFLGLGGDGHRRRERRELELAGEHLAPVDGLAHRRLDQVDLVDDDHEPLARFQRVARDVLVLGEHARRRVNHQQDAVGALHGVDAAEQAVALEPVAARRLATNPRRVDQDHRRAVEDELGVNRIPRRAGRRTDERTLVTQQRVQKG